MRFLAAVALGMLVAGCADVGPPSSSSDLSEWGGAEFEMRHHYVGFYPASGATVTTLAIDAAGRTMRVDWGYCHCETGPGDAKLEALSDPTAQIMNWTAGSRPDGAALLAALRENLTLASDVPDGSGGPRPTDCAYDELRAQGRARTVSCVGTSDPHWAAIRGILRRLGSGSGDLCC